MVILHGEPHTIKQGHVGRVESTCGVVVGGREVQRARISPLIDHVVHKVKLTLFEPIRRISRSKLTVDADVGHVERTAIYQGHPLVIGVGAHLLHRLTKVNPLGLSIFAECRRSDHVALSKARIFESGAHTLNPVIHSFVTLGHIGDLITSSGQDELNAGDYVGVHHFDRSVKHAAGQIHEG